MPRSTTLIASLVTALAISLAGCSTTTTELVTGSIAPPPVAEARPKPTVRQAIREKPSEEFGTKAEAKAREAATHAKAREICDLRHVDHSAGKKPGGRSTLYGKQLDDARCKEVYAKANIESAEK